MFGTRTASVADTARLQEAGDVFRTLAKVNKIQVPDNLDENLSQIKVGYLAEPDHVHVHVSGTHITSILIAKVVLFYM